MGRVKGAHQVTTVIDMDGPTEIAILQRMFNFAHDCHHCCL
ncbi:hypothetical protein AM1_4169 [Acaryochloris marina MBIC11017]|uniref:Uncharacterized protein n=1 Tax=Acaryochloris marina (strain MBIC 11017) TaxID=329726 RepID=B0CBN1_ACAM1|nr:hypothetical protein AM1_4169 [Acaryochloris marina MBIC11017]